MSVISTILMHVQAITIAFMAIVVVGLEIIIMLALHLEVNMVHMCEVFTDHIMVGLLVGRYSFHYQPEKSVTGFSRSITETLVS